MHDRRLLKHHPRGRKLGQILRNDLPGSPSQTNQTRQTHIETRPVKFGWNEKGCEKSSTLVAVYTAVEYIAEVKGICMQLAYGKTEKEGLGLLGSQFHMMDNLRRATNTRSVILSAHEKFVSKNSICTISAETHNLDVRATTDVCKDILTTTFHSAKNIQTKRDLLYAFIKINW